MSHTHVYFTKANPAQPAVIAELPVGTFVYRIRNTGYSSDRFGACEVCQKRASEMYHQVEALAFDADGKVALTYHECHNLYGHEACLLSRRR